MAYRELLYKRWTFGSDECAAAPASSWGTPYATAGYADVHDCDVRCASDAGCDHFLSRPCGGLYTCAVQCDFFSSWFSGTPTPCAQPDGSSASPKLWFREAPLGCREECRWSSDNDCDDGGPGAEYALCDDGALCNRQNRQ